MMTNENDGGLVIETMVNEVQSITPRRQWTKPELQMLEDSSIENGSQNAAESQNGLLS